jgi:hypothetical protein
VRAVFGAVTVTRGVIVKSTSLTSETAGVLAQLARIRACEVGGPVTNHEYDALDAAVVVCVVTRLHVAPPSRLTSKSMDWPRPKLCVARSVWADPARQLTAVLGAVTVI